jgi:hypothetical protein
MGFLNTLLGKDQAKAAKNGAALVNKAELENKQTAIDRESWSLDDLDKALDGALGSYSDAETRATGQLDPYAKAGSAALSQQADLQGLNGPEAQAAARARFQTDPGYRFRLEEGANAIDASRNAAGGRYSGATLKALSDYGQETGAQEYGSYYSRLSDLAGRGQEAAGNIASTITNFGQQKAQALLGTGQNKGNTRLSALPHITGANTGAATATATGMKQAADAKAAGVGNLVNIATGGLKALSGFNFGGGASAPAIGGNGYSPTRLSGLY